MNFYAYPGTAALGKEKLGTEKKLLFELKTIRGAISRCRRIYGQEKFSLYSYSNFYNNSTFKKIALNKGNIMFQVLVKVRLPDGSTAFLPAVTQGPSEEDKDIVPSFTNEKHALMFAKHQLPDLIKIQSLEVNLDPGCTLENARQLNPNLIQKCSLWMDDEILATPPGEFYSTLDLAVGCAHDLEIVSKSVGWDIPVYLIQLAEEKLGKDS